MNDLTNTNKLMEVDRLSMLITSLPPSGNIAIFPNRTTVAIEYYGKTYCGDLEEYSGNWRVEGKSLEEAVEMAIDRLHKFLEENNEELEES